MVEKSKLELSEIRTHVDEIDSQISALLAKRYALALQVAKLKTTLNIAVQDCARENEILENVASTDLDAGCAEFITNVYEQILKSSRAAQEKNM